MTRAAPGDEGGSSATTGDLPLDETELDQAALAVDPPVATATQPPTSPPRASTPGEPVWTRSFLIQIAIATLAATSMQAVRPMVTYRALDLGAGPVEIGLMASAFSILPVMTAVATGRWVDRIGELRFIIAALAIMTIGSLLIAAAPSLALLALGSAIMGFGQITNLVASQAMVANRGGRERREQRFGWYSMAASVGQLLGPALAAVIVGGAIVASVSASPDTADLGNREGPVFLFAAVATAIAFGLAFGLPRLPPARLADGTEQPGLRLAAARVLRRSGMRSAMFVSIAVITTLDVIVAYLPAYGAASGIGIETIALLLAVRGGASLVSRAFMTQLIDLLGRKRLLAFSTGLAGGCLALLPFISSEPLLYVLMVLIGLGLGLGQPMTIAWVANRSPREERGLALGIRLTGNRSALLVVPTTMGLIAGASGIGSVFVAMALVLVVGAVVAFIAPFDEPLPEQQGRPPTA